MLPNYSIFIVEKQGNMSHYSFQICVTNNKDKAMMQTMKAIAENYLLIQNGNYTIRLVEYNIIPESVGEVLNSMFVDHAAIEHNAVCDYQAAERSGRIQNRYLKFTSDYLNKYIRR